MAGIFYEDESDLDEGVAGLGSTREQALAEAKARASELARQKAAAMRAARESSGPSPILIAAGVVAIGLIALKLRR